jgi:HSP20 family protein
MTVVRWSPWGQVATLQSDMARLMNQFLGSSSPTGNGGSETAWLPPVDVSETEDALLLHFDLPGISQNDISVELNDNVLTVSGQRERKHEVSKDTYYRFERRFGAFSRSVTLPAGVSEDDISATYENGVLEVRVPKPEEQKPRRIQVGAGAGAKSIEGKGSRKS